jgi:hypothetical protein
LANQAIPTRHEQNPILSLSRLFQPLAVPGHDPYLDRKASWEGLLLATQSLVGLKAWYGAKSNAGDGGG